DVARGLDRVAFGDVLVLAQDHGADGVALEVQREAEGRRAVGRRRELQHFAGHRIGQAVDAADAVGHRNDGALVADVGARGEAFDPALDQFGNLCGIELHDSFLSLMDGGRLYADSATFICSRRALTEVSSTWSP